MRNLCLRVNLAHDINKAVDKRCDPLILMIQYLTVIDLLRNINVKGDELSGVQTLRDRILRQETKSHIDHVVVHTFTSAARLSKIVPHDTDEAQYNTAYPVATAIVNGNVGYPQICNEALGDPAVLEMIKKLSFVVDPEMDSQFPEKRLAWVEFFLKDGHSIRSRIYEANGEATGCVDLSWMLGKFAHIMAPFLNEADQKAVLGLLTGSLDQKVSDIVNGVNAALKRSSAQ